MATSVVTKTAAKGGSFLLESPAALDVFTPADLTDDQKLIGQTAEEFVLKEVLPLAKDLENKKPGLMAELIRKGGELGLMGGGVPEEYGGAGLDKIATTVLTEKLSIYGGFAVTHGAHAGIGTLPIVYFGTEEQKQKYLAKLATAELIGAYCLTQPPAGSDAQNSLTRAELNSEGTHYVLNGQKMWITNGGFADLYIVFAKIDGEKFSAFIVERKYPGCKPGNEEHKMGIHGSSTTPVFLENCKVPKENLLHEIGRGHIVAFNVLNAGRLLRRRFEARAHELVQIHEGAKSLRQANRRIRLDEGEAGRNGHSDLCRRIHGVPFRGQHRSRHGGCGRLRRQNSKHHEGSRGIRHRELHRQGLRQRDARFRRRRRRADLRWLRFPRRISGLPRLSRLAHQPHLRGHQ